LRILKETRHTTGTGEVPTRAFTKVLVSLFSSGDAPCNTVILGADVWAWLSEECSHMSWLVAGKVQHRTSKVQQNLAVRMHRVFTVLEHTKDLPFISSFYQGV
jgi:hypothetical protein